MDPVLILGVIVVGFPLFMIIKTFIVRGRKLLD
jgi:hypothetical protein